MALKLPRITLRSETGNERDFGALSTLSLGYGIHQGWIYATMFGSTSVFAMLAPVESGAPSPVFASSIFAYAICLILFGIFDQRVLPALVERKMALFAAILVFAGTLLIPPSSLPGALGSAAMVISGVLTGVGSATLICFWGTAFARQSAPSIILNSAVAIFVGMLVYALLLHIVHAPIAGILAALLPLCEVALLWYQTPKSFIARHEIPIFNPLPIRRLRFFVLIGLPMLLFGLVLGFMRSECITYMMPRIELSAQIPFLLAAGLAMLIIILAGFVIINDDRASALLRPLLPIVAISVFFMPLADANSANVSWSVVVATGYMCFEGLLWILMGTLAQRYRISPVLIFGIGRGFIAVGVLAALSCAPFIGTLEATNAYGEAASIAVLLVALVAGFAFMPHESDIKRAVVPAAECGYTVADLLNITEEDDAGVVSPDASATQAQEGQGASVASGGVEGEGAEAVETAGEAHNVAHERTAGTESAGSDAAGASGGGLFRKKCERIADRYLLSTRETEVLFYLAKGHNAAFLQEKLYISEGTAKTHIRHIYGKTNVHNQQELMRMVADEWID